MRPSEHPAWEESAREARLHWPGLPAWAFALAKDAPLSSEITTLDAPIVALLARAFMLLKESNDAKEEMHTGTDHLILATIRMAGSDVPDRTLARALDADLDRFRRGTGEVPNA